MEAGILWLLAKMYKFYDSVSFVEVWIMTLWFC